MHKYQVSAKNIALVTICFLTFLAVVLSTFSVHVRRRENMARLLLLEARIDNINARIRVRDRRLMFLRGWICGLATARNIRFKDDGCGIY
jgi:hypothetical protein